MTKKVAKIPAISRFVLVPWCINDDPQNPGQISSRTRPHDACQGRQPRSPGSDVTATANNNNFRQVFQQNTEASFKSDVALKHTRGQRPAEEQPQKERRTPARAKKQDQQQVPLFLTLFHGIVPSSNEMSLL